MVITPQEIKAAKVLIAVTREAEKSLKGKQSSIVGIQKIGRILEGRVTNNEIKTAYNKGHADGYLEGLYQELYDE